MTIQQQTTLAQQNAKRAQDQKPKLAADLVAKLAAAWGAKITTKVKS